MEMLRDNSPWDLLAYSIVEKAAEDYYEARFNLDTANERRFKVTGAKTEERLRKEFCFKNESTLVELHLFFHSDWFDTLVGTIVDGERAWEGLQRTYKKRYPDMYKSFEAEARRKAIRRIVSILANKHVIV